MMLPASRAVLGSGQSKCRQRKLSCRNTRHVSSGPGADMPSFMVPLTHRHDGLRLAHAWAVSRYTQHPGLYAVRHPRERRSPSHRNVPSPVWMTQQHAPQRQRVYGGERAHAVAKRDDVRCSRFPRACAVPETVADEHCPRTLRLCERWGWRKRAAVVHVTVYARVGSNPWLDSDSLAPVFA